MKSMFKKYKEKGALFVLYALFLPMLLMLTALAIDIGVLYMERTRLQGVADAVALAGARTYQASGMKNVTADIEQGELLAPKAGSEMANKISATVLEYIDRNVDYDLNYNNVNFAKSIDTNIVQRGELGESKRVYALEYTNFMDANGLSNYHENIYDGPTIPEGDNPKDYIGKMAVQCGVPGDYVDRVRVRLQKIVPTIMMGALYPEAYGNGIAITVVAAAEPQATSHAFRMAALRGIYCNYTDMVTSDLNGKNIKGYIDGDVYAGDILKVTFAHTDKSAVDTGDKIGYGANAFTVNGKIYARNFSTGANNEDYGDIDLFARAANGNYLYYRIIKDNQGHNEYEYTSAYEDGTFPPATDGWKHCYNFERFWNWQRIKAYEIDPVSGKGSFEPVRPHRIRLGLAAYSEKQEFKEKTKLVRQMRLEYMEKLDALYAQAKKELAENPDETRWRRLVAGQSYTTAADCTIKPTDTNIKLLVEIPGVETNFVKSGDYHKNQAVAWLTGNRLPQKLNIETMVVVVTKNRNADGSRLADLKERKYTGVLYSMPSSKEQYDSGYQEITYGDIFSETNLCLKGKMNTFNGIIFSEKNIIFPTAAYGESKDARYPLRNVYGGSCSMLADHIVFGFNYLFTGCPDAASSIASGYALTAGLDYPTNFYDDKIHGRNSGSSVKPMHTRLLGLTDEQFIIPYQGDDEDDGVTPSLVDNWNIVDKTVEDFKYSFYSPYGRLTVVENLTKDFNEGDLYVDMTKGSSPAADVIDGQMLEELDSNYFLIRNANKLQFADGEESPSSKMRLVANKWKEDHRHLNEGDNHYLGYVTIKTQKTSDEDVPLFSIVSKYPFTAYLRNIFDSNSGEYNVGVTSPLYGQPYAKRRFITPRQQASTSYWERGNYAQGMSNEYALFKHYTEGDPIDSMTTYDSAADGSLVSKSTGYKPWWQMFTRFDNYTKINFMDSINASFDAYYATYKAHELVNKATGSSSVYADPFNSESCLNWENGELTIAADQRNYLNNNSMGNAKNWPGYDKEYRQYFMRLCDLKYFISYMTDTIYSLENYKQNTGPGLVGDGSINGTIHRLYDEYFDEVDAAATYPKRAGWSVNNLKNYIYVSTALPGSDNKVKMTVGSAFNVSDIPSQYAVLFKDIRAKGYYVYDTKTDSYKVYGFVDANSKAEGWTCNQRFDKFTEPRQMPEHVRFTRQEFVSSDLWANGLNKDFKEYPNVGYYDTPGIYSGLSRKFYIAVPREKNTMSFTERTKFLDNKTGFKTDEDLMNAVSQYSAEYGVKIVSHNDFLSFTSSDGTTTRETGYFYDTDTKTAFGESILAYSKVLVNINSTARTHTNNQQNRTIKNIYEIPAEYRHTVDEFLSLVPGWYAPNLDAAEQSDEVEGSNSDANKKYLARHIFGMRSDSPYTAIRLVE